MPEGDSLFRAAERLVPIVGGALVRLGAPTLRGSRPRAGETIDAVRASGKHLLIEFSGGLTLDTHLGMAGRWSIVGPVPVAGDPPPASSPHLLRVELVVDRDEQRWAARCSSAPTVRTMPTARVGERIEDRLGPDLMRSQADLDECLRRWEELIGADAVVADALLDQRVANGVGNVFMSEACWRAHVAPISLATSLDAATRRRLLADAATLLRANARTGPRRTVPGGVAVYGRRGRPCRRCGTPITSARVGRFQRSAYWCPRCQPDAAAPR